MIQRPDLVCCWPEHLDYPLWRKFIHDNRSRFSKVIVVFTNMNTKLDSYKTFVIEAMLKDQIIFVDNNQVAADQDWRSVATNKGLTLSDNEWVWFWEQDFTPKFKFWDVLDEHLSENDLAYINVETRMHPACLLIKRTVLDQTSKDFSVHPPEYDHFGKIQIELESNTPPLRWLQIMPHLYHHMNGLSQNMYLLQIGEEPNYNKEEFKEYLKACLKSKYEGNILHPDFVELAKWYIDE